MSDDPEFDKRSDALQESKENARVTETGDGSSEENCLSPQVPEEVSGSPSELGSGVPMSEVDATLSRNEKSEDPLLGSTDELRIRVCSERHAGSLGTDTSAIDPSSKLEGKNEPFQGQIDRHHALHDREEHLFARQADDNKFSGSDSKSLLSEFDDYVADERNGGVRPSVSRDLGFGFEVGDMVWGKVKSHPWWPGHIYNEAFASPSVRRTKREGHILVAFFGDSSYGWFERAELVPFDSNFAEKSKQTNSRTFLKAVEESVDELNRRRALGLVCKCRSPNNFRPTYVQGHFSVDVPDYEPGGLYSNCQIRKARNCFKPSETLAFVKQLALDPHGGEHESISFIKNKATVFAYRKAVFEQYDETYAQAFGVHPLRPSDPQNGLLNQPVRQPPKAPLSGPLVMAEALGGQNKTMKSVKVKDNSKKDRYLFKRRDESSNSSQLACREETPDAAGHYVFQKRGPAVHVAPQNIEKHEETGFIAHDSAASTLDAKEVIIGQAQLGDSGLAAQAITSDAKPYLDKGKESSVEMTPSFEQGDVLSKNFGRSDMSGEVSLPSAVDEKSYPSHMESKISVDVKHDRNSKLLGPCEDFKQTEQGLLTSEDGESGVHQFEGDYNVYTSTVEAKHHQISAAVQVHKRPADDLNSKTSATGEKKKKKKKGLNLQPSLGHPEKHSASGKSVFQSGKLTGKHFSIGSVPGEDFQAEHMQVNFSASNLQPSDTTGSVNFELPQLLGDLHALALDPFHGVERKIPAVVQLFFLRFRSLVYQKSLFLSPPTENEATEVRVTKSPSSVRASDSPDDQVRTSSLVKSVKHIVRPDDPSKVGQKRAPSDRQEEIAVKRLKKIKDLKARTVEKTAASHKSSDARRGEGKEFMSQAPPKFVKPDSARKAEREAKAVEPTMLAIKFPPKTSLPSVAELKARFARFGPIDQSGLRVFWKTSTCRVVFLHKVDAQAAYKYALANQSLFGNVGVKYFLREIGDPPLEVSEAAKARGDDGASETPRVKDPVVAYRQISGSLQQSATQQPMIQLKSILKKSTGDESGQVTGNGGSSRGNPRVKFILGGEESSRGEQLMVGNRNNFNYTTFADGGAPSPVAIDFNSKNVQMVTSQPPMHISPLATRFTKAPQHNFHNSEVAYRNTPNFINTSTSASATTVDISQQMISLLTRCSDVVTNLTGLLGYVPYHPL